MLLRASSTLSLMSSSSDVSSPAAFIRRRSQPIAGVLRVPQVRRLAVGAVSATIGESDQTLTGVLFEPFEEVKQELALVTSSPGKSLARQKYVDESEAAINEQIKEVDIVSVFRHKDTWPLCIEFLRSGKIDMKPLITHRFRFSQKEVEEAIKVSVSSGKAVKVMFNLIEYNVSYVYHAMFAYFDRDNVALRGIAKFFKESSDEERDHAEKLMKYQNKRGGRVKLQSILMPLTEFHHEEKGDALYAMELALSLERLVNEKLLNLHSVASRFNDPQMTEFIESQFLGEQVEAIKKISEYVTQLRRLGKGHGVWHFDQLLLHERENGAA